MVRSLLSARFSSRPSSAVKPPETVTLVPKASPSSLLHCWIGGASSGAAVRDKSSSKTPPVRIRCRSNFSFLRFSCRPSSAVKPPETATLVPKASPSSLLHCWIGGASSGAAVRDKSSSKTPPVRIRCRSNFSFLRFSCRPSSAVKPPETATLVPKASPSSLLHCWIGGASSGAAVRDKSSSKTPPVRIRCRSNFSFLRSPFGEFYIWIS
ncbi:hypothetical protein ACLB2K_006950 [Fragaria x ananassa]